MTTITTQRNRVITEEPEADDVFVRVSLTVPGDEPGRLSVRHLPYQPISDYDAAVAWAVSMADQLAYPIHVVPLSYSDIRNTGRFQPICDAVASMDDQQRGAMRAVVVTTCAEVMRDCDDLQVRADCYDILTQLKVITS
ncbi:hypothetical protein C1T17_09505 [Sphingobium sp. SCG-1]|uniref:hypothetical protein n=1 Tax=Sphingobium sp. SCG-1 TaxID=2072936 RepID=UPI000CD69D12|nr:hypothetical protein [Sphingobium sp. SCG-1]AUW58302.1 hypothetical protein C1T17_09505 [Sphingobium sp. SCG-1]